jgi:hypothetical protein
LPPPPTPDVRNNNDNNAMVPTVLGGDGYPQLLPIALVIGEVSSGSAVSIC